MRRQAQIPRPEELSEAAKAAFLQEGRRKLEEQRAEEARRPVLPKLIPKDAEIRDEHNNLIGIVKNDTHYPKYNGYIVTETNLLQITPNLTFIKDGKLVK